MGITNMGDKMWLKLICILHIGRIQANLLRWTQMYKSSLSSNVFAISILLKYMLLRNHENKSNCYYKMYSSRYSWHNTKLFISRSYRCISELISQRVSLKFLAFLSLWCVYTLTFLKCSICNYIVYATCTPKRIFKCNMQIWCFYINLSHNKTTVFGVVMLLQMLSFLGFLKFNLHVKLRNSCVCI